MPRTALLALALPCLLTACPAPSPGNHDAQGAVPVEADPRVARHAGDLYSRRDLERNLGPAGGAQEAEAPRPGSGKPDESNGVCRLYAPRLPAPECCAVELGFDEAFVRKTCGYPVYLGESFHFSCGYYFLREGKPPAWMRLSFIPGKTPAEAAASHDRQLARLAPSAPTAQPIPGVPGAFWSFHDGLAWAFLPGWDRVRQLAWRDEFCDRKAMIQVIGQIVRAKQPAPGSPRDGLLPKARK